MRQRTFTTYRSSDSGYLLPGFSTGILSRHCGQSAGAKVGNCIFSRLHHGTSKFVVPSDRSTRTQAPTTTPPILRTTSIVCCTRPPLVTTSSATKNFSPGVIVKPRRSTSPPTSSFSKKMWRKSSAWPTPWPTNSPPNAGEITVCAPIPAAFFASSEHSFAARRGYCNTSAHWKYRSLCRPDRNRKCPSNSALVSRKS